jgi:hypothetical protein
MMSRVCLTLLACAAVTGSALVVRAQGGMTGDGTAGGAPGALAAPPSNTVKITIITVPQAKKVLVMWGKKKLGLIAPKQPLILQRPRDSGPLDLIVQAEGYVPVQTRAYTFADTKLAVKLTPIDQKKTILGYRAEVPSPDAGAPPPPLGAPPTAAAPPIAPAPDAGLR